MKGESGNFPNAIERPIFLADEMLGRLAKWMRILGYDTRYVSGIPDSDVVTQAESEGRIILTRDTRLILRKPCKEHIFVRSDYWREQLKQVYIEASLDLEAVLTLCSVCNISLEPVPKTSVENHVPVYVYNTEEKFSECPSCGRIFWAATHVGEIMKELKTLGKGN